MKNFIFYYSVYSDDECIYNGSFNANLTDYEVKEIAEVMMKNHGGFKCGISECTNLSEKLWHEAANDYQEKNEEADWDNISLEVSDEMPSELILAVNPLVLKRTVSIPYYITVKGKENRSFVTMDINKQTYEAMIEIAMSEHESTDFDQLREVHEVVYHGIIYDLSYLLDGIKNEADDFVRLKEFPHEIYDNI